MKAVSCLVVGLLATPCCCWDRISAQIYHPTITVLDTTLQDRSCKCRLLLLRPISISRKDDACLHITLCGKGTRNIAKRATQILARTLDREGSCSCIVEMGESKGTSVASLPVVAGFMANHRKHLSHISVLSARGLALQAVRVVSRLSKHGNIKHYRSLKRFESASDGSSWHRLATFTARRAADPQPTRRRGGGRHADRWRLLPA